MLFRLRQSALEEVASTITQSNGLSHSLAQLTMSHDASNFVATLTSLPAEVLNLVVAELDTSDLKSLAPVCRLLTPLASRALYKEISNLHTVSYSNSK